MSQEDVRRVVGWVFDELEGVRTMLKSVGAYKYLRRAFATDGDDDDPIICCLLLICCESRAEAIEKVTARAYEKLRA